MDSVNQDFYQPTPKEKQVWQVCDSLYAEQRRITYQSIGERLLSLGLKRGSNTDICRYLASWKKFHFPKMAAKKNKPPTFIVTTDTATPSKSPEVLEAIQDSLNLLAEDQKRILELLNQTPTTSTSASQPKVHALLIDIIKKQQEREAHYLKALAHARDIQTTLKLELEKYQRPTAPSDELESWITSFSD